VSGAMVIGAFHMKEPFKRTLSALGEFAVSLDAGKLLALGAASAAEFARPRHTSA